MTLNDKISIAKLNEILPNSVHTIWSIQTCVKGFNCESITLKKAVNMFERMETTEYTYEGLVEPTYKNLTV